MKRMLMMIVVMLVTTGWVQAADFTLRSPQVKEGMSLAAEQVFNGFGCSGDNVSPQFDWSGAPEGTKSFALTVYDPDAPTGSGWWHWVIFNIPAEVTHLPRDAGDPQSKLAPPDSVQSRTDFGAPGYGGPCPPPGAPHRYVFTLYALKIPKLDLDPQASAAMVGFNLNASKLATASLAATYGR